ncbi:hypothetical protein JQC92_09035 [Shewanella sp. 202IG2-18]|uniref:hypothetical protein n=1 Tax=Parashewanella hymeniacidonis TaxID=2807618 RepID=UPI001961D8C4|nr:hypothetical protein [Parashewanella hymeniacidonis]MBM7072169.1 hypothetical protein [Parashewanella hymeniacidonis]
MSINEIKALIDSKAEDLNRQGDLAGYVASKIDLLNAYIDQQIELSESQIEDMLSELVGFFSTSLHIPLEPGLKILRARAYKTMQLEQNVSQLSYIAEEYSDKAGIGRLNEQGHPVYYGCIYFSGNGGVNVAFSESNSKVGDTVNVLRSELSDVINVYYVGIYDHVRRQSKPRFMPEEMFDLFCKVNQYQEKKYTNSVFLAHILCDAFLSDILRRKENGNLYKVTSKLLYIFTEDNRTDGIIYTSVKSEGDPVVALKISMVDDKMVHNSCDCYRIEHDYGYALYKAAHTHTGSIQSNNLVTWTST